MTKKILWFVAGPATSDQMEFAQRNGLTIRDPLAYRQGDFLEQADAVAGEVPRAYSVAYDLIELQTSGAAKASGGQDGEPTLDEIKVDLKTLGVAFDGRAGKAALAKLLAEAKAAQEPSQLNDEQVLARLVERGVEVPEGATSDSLRELLKATEEKANGGGD